MNVKFLPVSNVIELPSLRPLFISGKKRTKRFVGTSPRLCFPIDQKSSHFGKFVEEQIEEGDVSHVHVRGPGFLVMSALRCSLRTNYSKCARLRLELSLGVLLD